MLRVDLEIAKPGMPLALSVYHPAQPGHILLRPHYALTENDVKLLRELRIHTIWVIYPQFKFLERYVDEKAQMAQQSALSQLGEMVEELQKESTAKLPYQLYCKSVGELIDSLASNPKAAIFMGDLSQGGDELMRHSSTVMYISVLMGLKLAGFLIKQRKRVDPARAKEVTDLGVGSMVHDIGVTQLPEQVREKYQTIGDDSDPQWREHPSLGYRMVHGKIDPSAAIVVLQHHQRIDGSGYAGADWPVLRDQRIHVFARIAGLADEFDRLRHPPHGDTRPTAWALRELLSQPHEQRFESELLKALFLVVPPFPPGSVVQLSDGRWAVVIDHVTYDPCRPVVQTIPGPPGTFSDEKAHRMPELNLSDYDRNLHITRHEGSDVGDMLFDAPPLLANARSAMANI